MQTYTLLYPLVDIHSPPSPPTHTHTWTTNNTGGAVLQLNVRASEAVVSRTIREGPWKETRL